MKKTNAVRLLELANVNYTTKEYKVSGNYTPNEVKEKLGMEGEVIFKTLVAKGDKNGINIFCIPLDSELDLKKSSTISGNKKIEMLPEKDLLNTTGYVRGGCSPIGMKKQYPTFIEESAIDFPLIGISGGAKGFEIIIKPEDLLNFVKGTFVDVTKKNL